MLLGGLYRVWNGLEVRFWVDSWINDVPLKDLFPNLFRIEKDKWCKVAARVVNPSVGGLVQWDWKRYPATAVEIQELIECYRMVANVSLNDSKDTWRWNSAVNCCFSVKEVRDWLTKTDGQENTFNFKWCRWVPGKCNVFMWRAKLDRIPTAAALLRRNIIVGDGSCYLCGEGEETSEHLFTACPIANGIWSNIASWLKIPPVFVFSIEDIVRLSEFTNCSNTKKKMIYGVCIVACWKIWASRNEVVFSQATVNVTRIVADIKSISFLWYNCRLQKDRISWKCWCNGDVT